MLTGDLHNSFAIKVLNNVWEFASGPGNSVNHVPADDEGAGPRMVNLNTVRVNVMFAGPPMYSQTCLVWNVLMRTIAWCK